MIIEGKLINCYTAPSTGKTHFNTFSSVEADMDVRGLTNTTGINLNTICNKESPYNDTTCAGIVIYLLSLFSTINYMQHTGKECEFGF